MSVDVWDVLNILTIFDDFSIFAVELLARYGIVIYSAAIAICN